MFNGHKARHLQCIVLSSAIYAKQSAKHSLKDSFANACRLLCEKTTATVYNRSKQLY